MRVKFSGEVSVWRGPAPDVDGAIALENGVVAKQMGEADVGMDRGKRMQETGNKEKSDTDRFHGGPQTWSAHFLRRNFRRYESTAREG
jgi:hypothetical protein